MASVGRGGCRISVSFLPWLFVTALGKWLDCIVLLEPPAERDCENKCKEGYGCVKDQHWETQHLVG